MLQGICLSSRPPKALDFEARVRQNKCECTLVELETMHLGVLIVHNSDSALRLLDSEMVRTAACWEPGRAWVCALCVEAGPAKWTYNHLFRLPSVTSNQGACTFGKGNQHCPYTVHTSLIFVVALIQALRLQVLTAVEFRVSAWGSTSGVAS